MQKYTLTLTLLLFCLSCIPIIGQERYQDYVWGGPIDPLQEIFEVQHYDIDITLQPEEQKLIGKVRVRFTAERPLDTLRLNLIDLYTVSLTSMRDEFLSFNHYGDTLDILLPGTKEGVVTIYYEGLTPLAMMPPWKGGFVWTRDSEGNHWMGLACQGEGAKIFMPCLDHPSSEPWEGVDLKVTVPHPYFVAGNGRLISVNDEEEGLQYHWRTQYPINNYLINFTMGKFHREEKIFNSSNGKRIPMVVYVLKENKEKAKELLEILERSARTQEKYFGPFPFPDDKIAIVETPYLGMEHQTINAYGNKFNYGEVNGLNHDWLLHHELGHEWWGNMVTVKDWSHFWIHEGLCTYGDWLFYLEHGGKDAYQKHVAGYAESIMNIQSVVAKENANSDESFHIEIYYKGAFIMHSLRFLLGDEIFFPMLRSFLSSEEYTYDQQITSREFTEFVQKYSGMDLDGFFQMYLYTTEVPKVVIQQKQKNKYLIEIPNIDFTLPMEVETSEGIQKLLLSSQTVEVYSTQGIEVDPDHWYLKEIIKKD